MEKMDSTDVLNVIDVEFASGQEPEETGFVTLVRVKYAVGGRLLASILGKQQRALQKHLTLALGNDKTRKQVLNAILDDRRTIERVGPEIGRFVNGYLMAEGISRRFLKLSVDPAVESDLRYSIDVYPPQLTVVIESEFDVMDVSSSGGVSEDDPKKKPATSYKPGRNMALAYSKVELAADRFPQMWIREEIRGEFWIVDNDNRLLDGPFKSPNHALTWMSKARSQAGKWLQKRCRANGAKR